MAGERDLLSRLRPQLAQLDDAALVVLASPGLLRRARKDLAGLTPAVSDEGERLVVDLGRHQVTFDARGPTHARCSCPAASTCQHVLAAWLHLRTLSSAVPAGTLTASAESLASEVLAFPLRALTSFAGVPAVREAREAAETGELPEIVAGPTLVIRLRQPPVELRYAGGGLEAFVLEYSGKRRKTLIAQGVLAFQRASGLSLPQVPRRRVTRARPERGPELAPQPLLEGICRTLQESIQVGTAHLSEAFVERFRSSSAAAEGKGLHRMALSLSRLASHVDLQLGRSAGTSTERLLEELAQAYALASAIRAATAPVPSLWGEARSSYEQVPELEVVGVAAEPWETASGYSGLTLLFWCPSRARWMSATDARPAATSGFDPVARYRLSGPWPGLSSPAAACGLRLGLTNAGLNRSGRLSLSESTRAEPRPLNGWPSFGGVEFADWKTLGERAAGLLPRGGLVEHDPHDAHVVLRAERWAEPRFDPTRQELIRDLLDASGERLPLRLRFSRLSEPAIGRLETLGDLDGSRIVARLGRSRGGLWAHPIALLHDVGARRVDNLFLDPPPKETLATTLLEKLLALVGRRTGPEQGEKGAPIEQASSATDRRLQALERELLRLSERGVSGLGEDGHSLRQLVGEVEAAGIALPKLGEGSELGVTVLELRHVLSVLQVLRG